MKTLVSVLRLTMLVGVLALLPYINMELNAQIGTSSCQTWTAPTSSPCPSCCPTHVEIPDVPFSTGVGIQSLASTPYSCGAQPASGCPVACSGTTYVAQNDNACCVAEGGSCSINAQCCGTPGDICKNGKCTAACQTDCPYPPRGCVVCGQSPILLDLNGNGFHLTNAANGVKFDISGTNNPIQMGWTASGADNAFLCLPDSNGKCDDGKDLFGNVTPQPVSDTPNGFAALAVLDDPKNGGNGDGIIDSRDAIFASLRLWIDANHDGISQPEELHTLPSLGVNSISLNYKWDQRTDQYGNVFRYRSKVNPNDPDPSHVGKTAYDVFFVTH